MPHDKGKRIDFSNFVLDQFENEKSFVWKLVFSDEATFHVSGKVTYSLCVDLGLGISSGSYKNTSVTPQKWIFAISNTQVYGPFFFVDRDKSHLT